MGAKPAKPWPSGTSIVDVVGKASSIPLFKPLLVVDDEDEDEDENAEGADEAEELEAEDKC